MNDVEEDKYPMEENQKNIQTKAIESFMWQQPEKEGSLKKQRNLFFSSKYQILLLSFSNSQIQFFQIKMDNSATRQIVYF